MESSNSRPVRPVLPVVPYIGGKRNLAERLVELIEDIDHVTYAECFMGMGGVFSGGGASRGSRSSTISAGTWQICSASSIATIRN